MYIDSKGVLGYINKPLALLSSLGTTETKTNVFQFNVWMLSRESTVNVGKLKVRNQTF